MIPQSDMAMSEAEAENGHGYRTAAEAAQSGVSRSIGKWF